MSEEKYGKLSNVYFPMLKPIHLKIVKHLFNRGDIRLLPKYTPVFSIEYQSMIQFDEDQIVEIRSMYCNNSDYFYGKLKDVIGITTIPTLIDKSNSEIGVTFSKTQDYTLPKPFKFVKYEKH